MKVSIYALHLGFGGVEKYVATIANILAKEHDVEIISTYKTTQQPAFFIDKSVNIRYLLPHVLPNNQEFKQACKSKNPFRILKEGMYSTYVLYQRKHQNIKCLKNDTSDVIISTRIFHNHLITKYAAKKIIKITGEHNHPNGSEKYMKKVVASCAAFDYFIPISKALCELYEKRFSTHIKVHYIPFCIEDSGIQTHTFTDLKQIINVGRFSPEKGILDLLDIVYELVYKKDFPITLHLIGNGEMEEIIQAKIKEYQIEEYVILHGFQNKEYIYKQYQNASLYVMTSFTESFGIVLLEAMSCGVPCIAFDSAQGSREIITNGKDGVLVSNRNLETMCMEIMNILTNQDMLTQMSTQAYKKADEYSYANCEKEWLSFFKQLHAQVEKRAKSNLIKNSNL